MKNQAVAPPTGISLDCSTLFCAPTGQGRCLYCQQQIPTQRLQLNCLLRPAVSVTFEQPVMTNFSWHYNVWCVRAALTAKLALQYTCCTQLYPVSQKQRLKKSLLLLFGLKRLGHYRLASSCHVITWHNMRFFPLLFLVVKAHRSTWLQPDPSRLKGAVCSRCSFKL